MEYKFKRMGQLPEHVRVDCYVITEDGHTLFPEDVVMNLNRLIIAKKKATPKDILSKAKELIVVSDEKKEELIEICQVDDKYREEVYEEINKFISSLFEEDKNK